MKNVTLILLVLILMMPCLAYSQPSSLAVPAIPNRAWTASDKPYIDVEQHIKKEYAQGKSLEVIAHEYKAAALVKPKDPVAQFAWIYAGRGAAWVSSSEGSMPRYLLDTLAKSDPGNVHEYTRYRFCLTDESDLSLPPQNAELIGNRLLSFNPKDNWVRLSLINMLCATPGRTQLALHYALDWVRIEPENSKAHSSVAQAYFEQWESSGRKNRAVGSKAISEYQSYLRLAPANAVFRPHALSYIKYIQQHGVQ